MTMTDPIADLITRVRNAARAGQTTVTVPASKLKLAIANVLKADGYLTDVRTDGPAIVLELALQDGAVKIEHLRRISKPGRRMYTGRHALPSVRSGLGTAVISTSQGVMSAKDARRRRLGGEILVEVY